MTGGPRPVILALAADELALARLAELDAAVDAWADAWRLCSPAEREMVRLRAARMGTTPDTWAELERLALEQEPLRWPRR